MFTTAKFAVKQDNFYCMIQLTFILAFSHRGCQSTQLFLHFFQFTVHLCHFASYFLKRPFCGITLEILVQVRVTLLIKSKLNRSFSLPLCFFFILYNILKNPYGPASAVSNSETQEKNIDIIGADSLRNIFVGKSDIVRTN